jgi:hypothetical protein
MRVIKCKSGMLMGISNKIEGAMSLGKNLKELSINLKSAEKSIINSYMKDIDYF